MARQRTVTKNRYIFFIINQSRQKDTDAVWRSQHKRWVGRAQSTLGWVRSLNSPPPTTADTFWLTTPRVASSTWAPSALLISGQTPSWGHTRNFSQLALLVRPTGYGMVKIMMMAMMMIKISICQTSFGQHKRVSVCFDMYACLVYAVWLFCSCCFFRLLSLQTP